MALVNRLSRYIHSQLSTLLLGLNHFIQPRVFITL